MACSFETSPGTAYSEVSAYGTRTDSAWVPSMRWPKIQPIPPMWRGGAPLAIPAGLCWPDRLAVLGPEVLTASPR